MTTRLAVTFAREWGILGVFLSCAAIGAGCDDTGEAGPDDPPMPRGTAVFSRATPGQLEIVLAAPDLALSAAEAALFVASLDHQSSRGLCPQIIPEGDTQVTVIGEGCMLPSGGSYQGTARYTALAPGSRLLSTRFDDFRRSEATSLSLHMDGSAVFTTIGEQDGVSSIRYATMLALAFHRHARPDADDRKNIEAELVLSAVCRSSTPDTLTCELEPGSWVNLAGVGRFDIEGSYDWNVGAIGTPRISGKLVFYGLEVLRAEYPSQEGQCVQYTIDDSAPETLCTRLGGVLASLSPGTAGPDRV